MVNTLKDVGIMKDNGVVDEAGWDSFVRNPAFEDAESCAEATSCRSCKSMNCLWGFDDPNRCYTPALVEWDNLEGGFLQLSWGAEAYWDYAVFYDCPDQM